jgi:hypothetical protein
MAFFDAATTLLPASLPPLLAALFELPRFLAFHNAKIAPNIPWT